MPLLKHKVIRQLLVVIIILNFIFVISGMNVVFAYDEPRYVVPGGQSVGVSIDLCGVYIDSLGEIETYGQDTISPAKLAGLNPGDIIFEMDGLSVKTVEEFKTKVNNVEENQNLDLKIRTKDGEIETKMVTPVRDSNDGNMKIGVWVKDAASGVGTITYFDPKTKEFAAVGHSISDLNSDELNKISGDVFKSEIVGVRKGEEGYPGELIGVYSENKLKIGSILSSNEFGIIGTITNLENLNNTHNPVLVGSSEEVSYGEAKIYSNVEGTKVEEYSIEIVEINAGDDSGKDIIFKVTDEALIMKTGGIVRGMSGSPIIQNDKIIGSVTHVLIKKPTMGYGVFIENMQK